MVGDPIGGWTHTHTLCQQCGFVCGLPGALTSPSQMCGMGYEFRAGNFVVGQVLLQLLRPSPARDALAVLLMCIAACATVSWCFNVQCVLIYNLPCKRCTITAGKHIPCANSHDAYCKLIRHITHTDGRATGINAHCCGPSCMQRGHTQTHVPQRP